MSFWENSTQELILPGSFMYGERANLYFEANSIKKEKQLIVFLNSIHTYV